MKQEIVYVEDALSWLEQQSIYPKLFWKGRGETNAIAGAGALFTTSSIPHFKEKNVPGLPFFGGMPFSPVKGSDPLWTNFPASHFFVPKLQAFQLKQKKVAKKPLPPFYERIDLPNREEWIQKVNVALEEISKGNIEKMVLARRTTLKYEEPLSPFALLRHLATKAERATLFCLQIDPDTAFLGATPEKLYERVGVKLACDAIAGTRRHGITKEEDLRLQQELLHSSKEQNEFACVQTMLHTFLGTLCSKGAWETAPQVLGTGYAHHLYNRFTGLLKPEIQDETIIRLLHPTPAVGGSPRQPALDLIDALEPFERGWYAAPLGWIGPNGADIVVGIRCALLKGKEMHLFAGTGIVGESVPQQEWEELEHKISLYLYE